MPEFDPPLKVSRAPSEFAKALLRHWGILVTSGAGIGALGLWQSTGHYIPYWVYVLVAVSGLVGACWRAWSEEREKVWILTKRFKESNREGQRELIQLIAILRAQLDDVLRWRGIVKDKWGMAPASVNLVPDQWPAIVFQAARISKDLRQQVETVGATIAKANATIREFLDAQPNFRNQSLMPAAYRLLDEAAPRLSNVVSEFEAYEKHLNASGTARF
jgi:hypothetical protein